MSVASTIIRDGSVDWNMLVQMQERDDIAYRNALGQLEDAGILSRDREGNHQAYGLSDYFFTSKSDAESYSTLMKNRVEMLLTCR